MNDYQRGLLRAAEICKLERIGACETDNEYLCDEDLAYNRAIDHCVSAIRAEAEKNADGHPQANAGELATGESQQAGCQDAPSAPDEALIDLIIAESWDRWRSVSVREVVKQAIREYLKRREGK